MKTNKFFYYPKYSVVKSSNLSKFNVLIYLNQLNICSRCEKNAKKYPGINRERNGRWINDPKFSCFLPKMRGKRKLFNSRWFSVSRLRRIDRKSEKKNLRGSNIAKEAGALIMKNVSSLSTLPLSMALISGTARTH